MNKAKIYLFATLLLGCGICSKRLQAQNNLVVDTLTSLIDGSVSPFNEMNPGDTLFFEHGNREFILLRNFHGSQDKPIIIINFGGAVIINTDHYYGMSIRNCQYIRISGAGDEENYYGFQIDRVENGGGIGISDLSSDIELDHVSIQNCQGAGLSFKTDPDCDPATTRGNFTQQNTWLHDNFISNVGFEGMYIGSTKFYGQIVQCSQKDTLLLPSLLEGVKIYNNIVKYTGWDGIQVSSAIKDCQVYDNLIMFDSQEGFAYQMSGILLGGGSKCDCYNNYISQGKGNGIENHGLGGNRIFNNIIIDAGRAFMPQDTMQMKHGIFVSDVSMQPDSSITIMHNHIINPKSDGIRFASVLGKNNLIASNLIINPGNYDFYENGNTSFDGEDSYLMIPDAATDLIATNNYFTRTAESAGISGSDYTLLPGSSLIDSAYNHTQGITIDFYHHARVYGSAPDIGAFEYNPAFLGISAGSRKSISRPMLFPNPASIWLTIRFHTDVKTQFVLGIYNLNGSRVLKETHSAITDTENEITVDIRMLPAGVYLYELSSAETKVSGKFIKVN